MDKLSLYFITWNVATRPPGESVRNLLDLGRFPQEELPDFYFIGLQEVKSQPQNFLLDAILEDPWTKAFKNALAPHDYVKIKTVRLVGILLNVFCLRKHVTYLRSMESGVTRTGLGGLWGNKGATSLRLEIYGVNLCVVNAHFAAHDKELKARILNYNTIIRDQTYQVDKETTKILYHDYVFWIGDLNFRLNNPEVLTQDTITDKIRDGALGELLAEDQLGAVMRTGEAFSELTETPPTFQPTFKYQFNSHSFDNKRRSAWTDRILYKVNENNYEDVKLTLEQLKYTSLMDYGTSDHKPVLSEFKIKVCPTPYKPGCTPTMAAAARRRRESSRVCSDAVCFDRVPSWRIDNGNNVTVNFGGTYQPSPWDWIGVYPENFSSLDDYLCYIYLPVPITPDVSYLNFPLSLDETGLDVAAHSKLVDTQHSRRPEVNLASRNSTEDFCVVDNELDALLSESIGDSNSTSHESSMTSQPHLESLLVTFPDSAIRFPGNYRLIYFTRRSADVLAVSNPFTAVSDRTSYALDW